MASHGKGIRDCYLLCRLGPQLKIKCICQKGFFSNFITNFAHLILMPIES